LTGTTPFDRERLGAASFDELRRIIREEEPPRPSARISTLGPAAVTLSEQRRTDPRQLGQLLRGELDWVVMKCLEKDRNRRYETADALARDVARYLADEPVEACPPSVSYRLGKFLRKHRRPLVTAAAFLALLAAAGVLAGWQVVREARAERDRAVGQAQRDGAVRDALDRARALREEARQERDPGKWARAREQAQRALTLVESSPAEEALAAQVRQVQEELDEEEKDRRFVTDLEAARLAQAETLGGAGRFASERAIPLYRKAFRDYGLPVGEGDPAAAATRLRRRPPEVHQAVSAALDDWLGLAANLALQVHEPHPGWLRALAATVSDGGGLREMEAAWQEPDLTRRQAALERLAATADPRQWPAARLTRLAGRLQAVGATGSAVQLLRRAWQQYPADFWVNEDLGHLLWQTEPHRWEEAVRHLTAGVALRPDSPGARVNLGGALLAGEQLDEAIACYGQAIHLDPRYAAAHFNLGNALARKGEVDATIASYRKAIDLDPKYARAHAGLGGALATKGQLDEAIACCRQAIELNPKYAEAHCNLGTALAGKGQVDAALASYQKAIDLDPKLANAHAGLGAALADKGQVDAAIASWRKAIALDPKLAKAHSNLGAALGSKGQLDEAIACCRQAIDLDPKYATAHCNLGHALARKGEVDAASASYKKAIALDPKLANAHHGLGHALLAKGQVDEASACYRRTIEINPKNAGAHYDLGVVLSGKGQVDEAVAFYRRTLELDPQYAEAHCNLGGALGRKGDFRAALASIRTGHALGSRRQGWPYPSAEWVKQYERCVQLDDLLAATQQGQARPAGPAECVELADFCRQRKQLPATAVRFYTEAFTAEPKLAADLQAAHRYRAAQSAALAGCGQGQEGASLDASERARLRRQALDWLRADLTLCTTELKTASPQTRQAVTARIQQWLNEPSLAGVRDPSGLVGLPAEERSLWQAFWAEVTAVRTRASEPQKPAASQPTPHPEK